MGERISLPSTAVVPSAPHHGRNVRRYCVMVAAAIKRPLTGESIIRVYRQEADKQKLLVKKAEVTQSRLLFIVEAIRELRDDENFANLLRAESLDSMPAFLEQRIADGMAT
jgi:RepB plasmid partitioning protein